LLFYNIYLFCTVVSVNGASILCGHLRSTTTARVYLEQLYGSEEEIATDCAEAVA
jgi:hypothetical protein